MTDPFDPEKLIRELDWNLLRTFMFIVQEGSITFAAKRLMLRQPSVSQALKRLETRLNTVLIDRGPSHFRITPAGQVLYQECLDIFGSLARTIQTTQSTNDVVTGKVKLALLSRIESSFFDEILTDFHGENPEVSFDLEVMSSKAVQQAVLEKSASLGVCLVHEKHQMLQYQTLYRSHFGFYCGPTHPLFGLRSLTLDDLAGHTSISFRTDQLRDALRPIALLRAQHRLDDRVIGYTSHLGEAQRMIVAGLGFGPLPVHVAQRLVDAGRLWRLPPFADELAIDVHLVLHKSARLSRAEMAFVEMMSARINATPLSQRTYPIPT
ncbi:LysR family transcriptional regulator [Halocynthiibacter namhaensis]|uniref:LysR family transcriptional regulator n=1 Tax=Halocynthiibacter namhaensis TaxID=1290553 RepID=UPI0005790A13|nr:LysR family transcriptional regulator [Halocynthiibacter namhaensis]